MTDLYGDVPYSEAGKGYLESIFTPRYDEQKTSMTVSLRF